jgi:hypothetical protein
LGEFHEAAFVGVAELRPPETDSPFEWGIKIPLTEKLYGLNFPVYFNFSKDISIDLLQFLSSSYRHEIFSAFGSNTHVFSTLRKLLGG